MKKYLFSKAGVNWVLAFSAMGALYSGLLAYTKLVTGVCAFGSPCPYLLGIPVCVFGFFGFLLLHLLAWTTFRMPQEKTHGLWNGLFWFSLGGTLFALYYLVQELFFLPGVGESSVIGFPSCLPGFILFGLIFFCIKYILTHWKNGKK